VKVQSPQQIQHDVHLIRELVLQKWPPKLQEKRCFEDTVSGMGRQLMLNSDLIPNDPKCPTLGGEQQPNRLLKTRRQIVHNRKEFLEGSGVPLHPKSFPDATPSKSSQVTGKENMIYRLNPTT
jgi:hypothetical protein